MDTAKVTSLPALSDHPLLHELAQLEPSLGGFPLPQLLEACVCAESSDRERALRLLDACLMNWIASLDSSLDDFPQEPDDALERIKFRQRGTRDALAKFQGALAKTDVSRLSSGQVCR